MLDCWKAVYRAARVGAGDRVFFPFSFGPFLGFWAGVRGRLPDGPPLHPGGGMSSQLRLAMIEAVGATVVCCTPTYALRLAEVAASTSGRTAAGGEQRARADRRRRAGRQHSRRRASASSELGRARHRSSRADRSRAGQLRVLGGARAPARQRGRVHRRGARSGRPASRCADGEPGELVVTNLGRTASPVIRYRTGDIVVAALGRRARAAGRGRGSRAASSRAPTTWSTSAA